MDKRAVLLFAIAACGVMCTESYTRRERLLRFCIGAMDMKKSNCDSIYVWNKGNKEFSSLLGEEYVRKYRNESDDLQGQVVRVIADNMLPYIISSNNSAELGGYLGEMWHIVEDKLKFTSSIISVNYDTGLEIINSGKADIMLAAAVEKQGLNNVEYSQPYFYNWYHIFLKQPEARASSSSYLKTLDSEVWLASLMLFLIFTSVLWLTCRCLSPFYKMERNLSIPSCLLAVLGGFINQGFDVKLQSHSARCQLMLALVFGVLLYSSMNALLVAKLAIFEIKLPFTSLDEVLDKRSHSLCLRTNSFVYNNFTENPNCTVLPQWKGILNGPGCLDINEQANLAKIICSDHVVVLENRVVMNTVIKYYKVECSIVNVNQKYFEKANSFLLLKAFRYKKSINNVVKLMKSTGILQRLERKWVQGDQTSSSTAIAISQVTMEHISGILYIYAAAVLASVLVLAGEMLHRRYFVLHDRKSTISFRI